MIHRLNVIWVLLWQNFTPRNRRDRLKLLWVFLEPIGQMVVLVTIFEIIGRTPGYGRSFAIFLVTGVATLTLYSRACQMVRGAVLGLSSPNRLPAVGLLHEAIARTLFMIIVAGIYTVALLASIGWWMAIDVRPAHWPVMVAGFLATAGLAAAIGLLRGYATLYAPPIDKVYNILSRGLLFVSGVFYAPSFLPPQLRDLLALNPVLHCVELVRLGFYDEYPSIVFDAEYLLTFALGGGALGVALLWRRRAEIMG